MGDGWQSLVRLAALDVFRQYPELIRGEGALLLLEEPETRGNIEGEPLAVPLLIPELRYEGKAIKHKYRLDFAVIDPITMQKTGFELSPWSSHGELTGTKNKTQAQINAEASANFDKEMTKHKQYFKKYGIFALIYTDSDLSNLDGIFSDIEDCLNPKPVNTQLNFHLLSNFFSP